MSSGAKQAHEKRRSPEPALRSLLVFVLNLTPLARNKAPHFSSRGSAFSAFQRTPRIGFTFGTGTIKIAFIETNSYLSLWGILAYSEFKKL